MKNEVDKQDRGGGMDRELTLENVKSYLSAKVYVAEFEGRAVHITVPIQVLKRLL